MAEKEKIDLVFIPLYITNKEYDNLEQMKVVELYTEDKPEGSSFAALEGLTHIILTFSERIVALEKLVLKQDKMLNDMQRNLVRGRIH